MTDKKEQGKGAKILSLWLGFLGWAWVLLLAVGAIFLAVWLLVGPKI